MNSNRVILAVKLTLVLVLVLVLACLTIWASSVYLWHQFRPAIVAPTALGCPAGSHAVYRGEDYDCHRGEGPAEWPNGLTTMPLIPVPYACKVWTWSGDRLAYVCSVPQ